MFDRKGYSHPLIVELLNIVMQDRLFYNNFFNTNSYEFLVTYLRYTCKLREKIKTQAGHITGGIRYFYPPKMAFWYLLILIKSTTCKWRSTSTLEKY
jgi:hypothetical protein